MGHSQTGLTAIRTRFWKFRDRVKQWVLGRRHTAATFTRIYEQNLWGDKESVSGSGSSLAATAALRAELSLLLKRLGVQSLLDAPCGDFLWMKEVVGGLGQYTGVDIVRGLIERNQAEYASDNVRFVCADICTDELPGADLVLCRDCFIHLPTALIFASLRNFQRTGARYLLLTNSPDAGAYFDIPVGSFRKVDFRQPPFCFQEPLCIIGEMEGTCRQLSLWDLSTLPVEPGRSSTLK
jgi:SAM-dependent methyltransferase